MIVSFSSKGDWLLIGAGRDILKFDTEQLQLKKIAKLPEPRQAPLLSIDGGKRVFCSGVTGVIIAIARLGKDLFTTTF